MADSLCARRRLFHALAFDSERRPSRAETCGSPALPLSGHAFADVLDDLDELVEAVAVVASEADEFARDRARSLKKRRRPSLYLVGRAWSGDRAAVSGALCRFSEAVATVSGDYDGARDAGQEGFARAYRSRAQFRGEGKWPLER